MIEIVALRHKLVRQRIQVYNRLQSLALNADLPKGRAKTQKSKATKTAAFYVPVEMNE